MSGVGRGRGWLNLKQNNQDKKVIPRPGSPKNKPKDMTKSNPSQEMIKSNPPQEVHSEDKIYSEDKICSADKMCNETKPSSQEMSEQSEQTLATFLNTVSIEECTELEKRLGHFSTQDDGIAFNQKLRYFMDYLKENCKNSEEFDKSFHSVYSSCLHNADSIPKFIKLVTAQSVQNVEIHGKKMMHEFLKYLQFDYERCEELQRINQPVFRNIIQMLGEFLSKRNFDPIKCGLLRGLEMLLENCQPIDLELFAKQLYMNHANLELSPTSPLIIAVRKTLATKKDLPTESIARLLLSLDIITTKSSLLSADLFQMYRDLLSDEEMSAFQGPTDMLSIQTTQGSKTLDAFQSKVSVLQVSSPSSSDNSSPPVNNNSNNGHNFNKVLVETQQNIGRWEPPCNQTQPTVHDKPGRPILGAGARLNKTGINARLKIAPPSQEGQNKNMSGMTDNRLNSVRSKPVKGWEHDDRFDKDYS